MNDERAVRAAKNQSLFRAINERIRDLNEVFDDLAPTGDWVCECADPGCVELMTMTLAEYRAVREHPARFPILDGHEVLDVERVVERNDRYIVVEKLDAGREVAERYA